MSTDHLTQQIQASKSPTEAAKEPTMRLAIIRRQYRPDGGAERIISRLIRGLQARYPIQIRLLTQQWQEHQSNAAQTHTTAFTVCLCQPAKKAWTRTGKFLQFTQAVQHKLKQHEFDIIQAHEKIAGCHIYRAGDGVHKKWLAIRRQHVPRWQAEFWRWDRFHQVTLNAEHNVLHHPNLQAVICNAEQIKQDILQYYPQVPENKLHVIPNGIDLQQFAFANGKIKQQARQQLGFDQDYHTRYALFVGSGFARKGLADLLQALAQTPKWQLIIVGSDKKQKHFANFAKKRGINTRVHFAGRQENVIPYYQACDLLVHPAWYDPAPNVILEAMSIGRGIICSLGTGNHTLLEQDNSGFVYQTRTELSDYLTHCDNTELLEKLGKNARKTAERYSIEKMTQAMMQIYQTILKNNSER